MKDAAFPTPISSSDKVDIFLSCTIDTFEKIIVFLSGNLYLYHNLLLLVNFLLLLLHNAGLFLLLRKPSLDHVGHCVPDVQIVGISIAVHCVKLLAVLVPSQYHIS